MPPGMYCTIHLLEIMRLSAFKSPLFYPSFLGQTLWYSRYSITLLRMYIDCIAVCRFVELGHIHEYKQNKSWMSEWWSIRTCTESPDDLPDWWWVIIGLGPQRPNARGSAPVRRLSQLNSRRGLAGPDMYCDGSCKRKTVPAALKGLLILKSSCQLQLHLCATMRNHLKRALRAGSVF